MTPEAFGAEVDLAVARTGNPMGVNIPVVRDPQYMSGLIEQALRRDLALIVLGGGNPGPWAERILAAGRRCGIVTATPDQARKAQSLGAHLVVVAGYEAGGKSGADEIGGMVLIPAVVDAVGIPVVATGGIVDGRSAAAAICLGASAVQLGTRFMLTEEAPLHPRTKDAMLTARISDTRVVARAFSMGRRMLDTPTARVIADKERTADQSDLITMLSGAFSERGLLQGDLETGLVSCGQGVGRIRDIQPAGVIVRRIADEIREVLLSTRRAVEQGAFA